MRNERVEIFHFDNAEEIDQFYQSRTGNDISALCGDIKITQCLNDTSGKLTMNYMTVPDIHLNFGDKILVCIDGAPVFIGILFDVSNVERDSPVRALTFYDATRYLQNRVHVAQNEIRTTAENITLLLDKYGIARGRIDSDDYNPMPPWMGKFDNKTIGDIMEHYLELSWVYHNIKYVWRCNAGNVEVVDLVKHAQKARDTFRDEFPAIIEFHTNETIDKDVYTISNFYLDESDVKNLVKAQNKKKKNKKKKQPVTNSNATSLFASGDSQFSTSLTDQMDLQSPTIHKEVFAGGLGVQTTLVMPEKEDWGPLIYNKVYKMEEAETVYKNAIKFADEHRLPLRSLGITIIMDRKFYLPADILYIYGTTEAQSSRYVIESVVTNITNSVITQEIRMSAWHKRFEHVGNSIESALLLGMDESFVRGQSENWLEVQTALIQKRDAIDQNENAWELIKKAISEGNISGASDGAKSLIEANKSWRDADAKLIEAQSYK